jgi:hypothetical protein
MAYCSKCGEKMEERIIYTPKTHKEKGVEYHCAEHGIDNRPFQNFVGTTNPNNHGCRDWGTILK